MDGSSRTSVFFDSLAAVIWTLIIFATVPFAQPVMQFLGSHLGGDPNLGKGVAAILFVALAGVVRKMVRRPGFGGPQLIVGVTVLAGYVTFMWTMEIPAEKIHFLEFGILVILVFRALKHAFAHRGVYLLVFPVCLLVGLVDEYIQSLVPQRVGEIADVMKWDVSAILLSLIGLAFAWVPEHLDAPLSKRQVWATCWTWTVMLVGSVVFVQHLSDFGCAIDDPNIGSFKSAFPKDELARVDAERGAECAGWMDESDDTGYREFLRKYTSKKDPYVHEARVHIFRRDRYLSKSKDTEESATPEDETRHLHIAAMENRILETYFPTLMAHSKRHRWGDLQNQVEGRLAERQALKADYISAVGKEMITFVRPAQIWAAAAALIAVFFVSAVWLSRRINYLTGSSTHL